MENATGKMPEREKDFSCGRPVFPAMNCGKRYNFEECSGRKQHHPPLFPLQAPS